MAVGVMQFHVEGLEAAQHCGAYAPGGDRSDYHSFHIVGSGNAVGDVPALVHHPLVSRNVVANQC